MKSGCLRSLDQGEEAAGGKVFVRSVIADLDHAPITLVGVTEVPGDCGTAKTRQR